MTISLVGQTIHGQGPGPHVLITGGVHGDEFEPMRAVRELIATLSPGKIHGRITLVPCVNEPAFCRGERTAEDGLDLARTCPGRSDGSVTEQVAWALSEQIRGADYYVDLHTGGTRLQVYPLAGYMLHADPQVLAIQRRMAVAFGLPLVWGTDARLNGRSLSVARDAHVPAIYAEFLGGGPCRADGIAAYVRGCRNVLIEINVLQEPSLATTSDPVVVEDERPNAGFMQICHPSPGDGFFEPSVALGQHVVQGEPFGVVTDVLGQHRLTVAAERSGCVIVLRSFSRVAAGDSLGVVLESPARLPQLGAFS